MRRNQLIIGLAAFIASWYGMMLVHEAGHCLGVLMTGGEITAVKFPLTGFSRTEFFGSTSPLLAIWAGPVFGAFVPLVLLRFLKKVKRCIADIILFFVGFSLLANGFYIGGGALLRIGDCHELLKHGAPFWCLIAFGVVAGGCGLVVWHQMGPLKHWFKPDKEE